MRTSLNEIKELDGYLQGTSPVEDRLVLEARLQIDNGLAEKVTLQNSAYDQIRLYSRKQLREEIASAEQQIFTQSKYQHFRQKVLALFKT